MKTLTLDQCRRLLAEVEKRRSKRSSATDRALLIAMLTCGMDARKWTWQDVVELFMEMPYPTYDAIKQIAISKQLSIFPYNHVAFTAAHWVNGSKLTYAVFTVGTKPLTTQEITRRMKRYARLAGISSELVSLRTLVNTHNLLIEVYSSDEIAEELGLPWQSKARASSSGNDQRGADQFVKWIPGRAGSRVERNPRLHGIGRRSGARSA